MTTLCALLAAGILLAAAVRRAIQRAREHKDEAWQAKQRLRREMETAGGFKRRVTNHAAKMQDTMDCL